MKLNTNESPFPPAPGVLEAISRGRGEAAEPLLRPHLCQALNDAIAQRYGLRRENVLTGNGSDEILAFAFRAFCGAGKPVAYADITYGFYKAQTALFGLDSRIVPLREGFSLAVEDYLDFPGTVVIANPQCPTGIAVAGTTFGDC